MSKQEELSRCDVEFLRAFATELNNTHRDYAGMDKNEIIIAIANKLSPSQVQTVIKLYLLCREADEVAKHVKQDGVNQINVAVKKHFDYDNMLYEVPVGNRVCDIVLLKGSDIIAIEVKSSKDKIARSIKQTKQYLEWSNTVHLVYDKKHTKKIKKLGLLPEVGLIEYAEGQLSEVKKARHQPISPIRLLQFMTHRFLRKIASEQKVSTKGSKKVISENLRKKLSDKHIIQLFMAFLQAQAVYQEKVTKQLTETERSYPLRRFLKEQ